MGQGPTIAVLAGGLATRLGELTRNTPKALLEVNGRPFLAWQLELFAANGITDVVLCLGHQGEQIAAWVDRCRPQGMRIRLSWDGEHQLGTGGALAQALPLLGDVFMVTYGDSYLQCDYCAVFKHFLDLRASTNRVPEPAGLMTVYENRDMFDASNVVFSDNRVLQYSKQNKVPEMRYIDWGLSVLTCEAFSRFDSVRPLDLSQVFEALVEAGRLAGLEMRERFYEIGSGVGLETFSAFIVERFGAKP